LKTRSDKLIVEMKDKYGVVVTEEHKKSGIFPWHASDGIYFFIHMISPVVLSLFFSLCLQLFQAR